MISYMKYVSSTHFAMMKKKLKQSLVYGNMFVNSRVNEIIYQDNRSKGGVFFLYQKIEFLENPDENSFAVKNEKLKKAFTTKKKVPYHYIHKIFNMIIFIEKPFKPQTHTVCSMHTQFLISSTSSSIAAIELK